MQTRLSLIAFLVFSVCCTRAEASPSLFTLHSSLSTLNAPCLACDLATGLVASVNGSSATLSWNAVNSASQYNIEVQDEQNIPSTFHVEASVNGTSYTVSGLQAGVKYKFKVRTRCGTDKSDWSDWVFFNGNAGGSGGACTVPLMLSASVNGTSAKLSWKTVVGAVKYDVEVEDEQNTPPSNFHVEASVQDSFYTITGLQAGVMYKFKVRANCGNGQSDWSDWLFFNGKSSSGGNSGNGSCAKPTGLLSNNVTAHSALLSWNAVPGVTAYTVEIERNQSSQSPWQITQVVATNSFLITGLNASASYKFKVRSNCSGGGHSDWAKWRKFSTLSSFTAPAEDRSSEPDHSVQTISALQLSAWPNPAQTDARIHLQGLNGESATLSLFDLTGRIVKEWNIQPPTGTWDETVSVANLHKGLYLLQIRDGQEVRTLKWVIDSQL